MSYLMGQFFGIWRAFALFLSHSYFMYLRAWKRLSVRLPSEYFDLEYGIIYLYWESDPWYDEFVLNRNLKGLCHEDFAVLSQ